MRRGLVGWRVIGGSRGRFTGVGVIRGRGEDPGLGRVSVRWRVVGGGGGGGSVQVTEIGPGGEARGPPTTVYAVYRFLPFQLATLFIF